MGADVEVHPAFDEPVAAVLPEQNDQRDVFAYRRFDLPPGRNQYSRCAVGGGVATRAAC